MDELKVTSGFMRGIVSKILESVIRKKLGYKVSVDLTELRVEVNNDQAHIKLNADATMNVNEFQKITRLMDSRD